MERDLTSGSVFQNVIYFSLPFFLSYFLQTLYGMADLFIVGQFDGVASTTAVSIGSQVMHMLTVMIVGLAMGATVSIGQSIGAGDKKRASVFVGNYLEPSPSLGDLCHPWFHYPPLNNQIKNPPFGGFFLHFS